MKNNNNNINSFWKKISCTHKKLSSKYKELDSVLTILGVMVVGSSVMTLCNRGTTVKAEAKLSLTDNKAEEYYFQGEYSKAIEEYTKMEKNQEWPYYQAKLAEVYAASGDAKRSNELLDEIVKKRITLIDKNGKDMYEKSDADLGTLVSYVAYINENPKALEYAKSFYDDNSDDFNLNIMMFTLYLSSNQNDKAINILDSLSKDDSDKSAYELAVISKMYITLKENDKGLDVLKEAWYKDKNDVKVYDVVSEITKSEINNLTGDIEKRANEKDEDETCYKVWLLKHYSDDVKLSSKFNQIKEELNSDDIGSYMVELIKQNFFKKQNNSITNKVISDLIDEKSDSYSANNIIAKYYQNSDNLKKALEYTTKSVNENKFYDGNYTENIPDELKEKNTNVRVEPYYKQALQFEPYNSDAIIELANYYKNKLSNNTKAYDFYKVASKINPDDSEIVYNMALIKIDEKDDNSALQLLDKCKELNPKIAKYYRTAGKIYYDNVKKDKAIAEIRKAYAIDKNDVKTLNNAGCYYIASGEDIDRGLYNLKCAYEMIKASDDIDVKRTITDNYESAKEIKKNQSSNSKLGVNPLLFEMID